MPLLIPNQADQKLPAPIYDNYEWQEQARCADTDTNYFYYEDYSAIGRQSKTVNGKTFTIEEEVRAEERLQIEREVKAICALCPVINECLSHALSVPERYGIWGGKSERERRQILKVMNYRYENEA
jgi:WhiB family redox-sensing transcriptional regulator